MKIKNIIIGAGPAGIQMADLLRDEEYLILEKADIPCSFFRKFPRQRKLISLNKGGNLRYDWNSFLGGHLSFRDYSEEMYPHVDDYLRYVNDFIKLRDIKTQYNFEVKSLEKKDDLFYINGGEYTSERVFFGIGLVHKVPIIPNSKGSSHLQVFTYENMPLDKEVYRGKNIIIVGSGNAAFETIKWIEPFTNKIRVLGGREKKAWQTHYPGHLRSVNFQSLDSYFLKARMFVSWDTDLNKLFTNINLFSTEYDFVIFCHGFEFKSKIIKDLVDVDIFPILTPHFESTKCKNLFFIGSNSQHDDYKKGTSAFIHGFRYNCQYLARYLKGLEFETITTRDNLVRHIVRDINISSALFHRFDYFCILIGFTETGYEYTSEIPLLSVPYHLKTEWKKYITIRLGYNDIALPSVFKQKAHTLPKDASLCLFLHPIIETSDGQKFHIPENAYSEFIDDNYHILPLKLYLDLIEGIKTSDDIFHLINNINSAGYPRLDLLS